MPNAVSATGLTIKSLQDVVDDLTTSLQTIYGSDINVNSNSPDGQLINIFAQSIIDNLELLQDIFNSFSLDQVYGTVLDQRVAINGVVRRAGTYTVTPVSITVDRALTLTGLDALESDPNATVFTVADSTGNQFQLLETQTPAVAGTSSYIFQAVNVGAVLTTLNTITNQVTVILGVTGVNNPLVSTTIGVNEETDSELKIRHAQMFQLAATGPSDSVRAALLEVEGVVDAYVVENETNGTVNSVPAHSIQAIVNGGTNLDVATAIYNKKAPGCGMYGGQSQVVTRPQGNSITIKFDRAVAQDLYIEFSIVARYVGATWDEDAVKVDLVAALSYVLGQPATIGDVVNAMLLIVPQGYLTTMGMSTDGMGYTDSVSPSSAKYYFTLATDRITIS